MNTFVPSLTTSTFTLTDEIRWREEIDDDPLVMVACVDDNDNTDSNINVAIVLLFPMTSVVF